MGLQIDPVPSETELPKQAEVVIIGGGIIGTSAALFLADKGIPVVLCEKGHVAGEQSGRNWGWVRITGRDTREIPLALEAQRYWDNMVELTGADVGFRRTGIMFACETEAEVARRARWLDHAGTFSLDTRMLSGKEVEELLPGAARPFLGALHSARDGVAEPQKAASAIMRAAQRKGARIVTDCAVRGIELAGGRVAAAVTEHGPIACSAVILAGGAWSALFCRSLGLRLPQLKVHTSVMRTSRIDNGPLPATWTAGVSFRRRLDGGYTVADSHYSVSEIVPDSFRFFRDFLPALKMSWRSLQLRFGRRFIDEMGYPAKIAHDRPSPYEAIRALDPPPALHANARAKERLGKLIPGFATARIVQHWSGFVDVTPDAIPVISTVDAIPGFHVATGFSGHGFGIGPAAGRLVADLVTGDRPVVDPEPFRFARFNDGSPPILQPAI